MGSYDDLHELLAKGGVDEVLLALPHSEQLQLNSILRAIRDETVDIRILPDVEEYVTFDCRLEQWEGFR